MALPDYTLVAVQSQLSVSPIATVSKLQAFSVTCSFAPTVGAKLHDFHMGFKNLHIVRLHAGLPAAPQENHLLIAAQAVSVIAYSAGCHAKYNTRAHHT